MHCSIQTGKSGSNWLDRLRSSKGFPASDLDLDHFLSNPQVSTTAAAADPSISESASAPPSQRRLPEQIPSETTGDSIQNGEWYGVLSNVLSELFNMGDSSKLPEFRGKKIPRKQANPRVCSAPVASAASLGSGNNSVEVKEESVDAEPREEKGDTELLGYSRSEVTVIDTSFVDWKFEKLVFRKKNVWKFRDKKGKPRSFVGRKKRKYSGVIGLENKKLKVSHSQLGMEEEETLMPSNEEHNPRNEKRKETSVEMPNDLAQALKRRISFSRSPRKPGMRGMLTSKKDGLNFPSKCYKSAPKHSEAC